MSKWISIGLASLLSACAVAAPPTSQPTPSAPQELRVMVHDSFSASENVLKSFEKANNAKLTILKSGDAGQVLNKAILSKSKPIADVIFGVDNTFFSRAIKANILEPYPSPALAKVPDKFKLDKENRLLPVDFGYVIFNYDKSFVQTSGLGTPTSLRELADVKWQHKHVVENAATSSPGLVFLLATIAEFPEGSAYPWQQFWRDMVRNLVHISPDWNDAYYNQFSASSGKGPHPLVVSYSTSPAAEVHFSDGKLTEPPTSNLDIGAFEQIEFVGILNGTPNKPLAEKFVDFMLSSEFQKDIPLNMFVYPVVSDTPLPEVFTKFAPTPKKILSLPPDVIDANRERWIEEWTKIAQGQ